MSKDELVVNDWARWFNGDGDIGGGDPAVLMNLDFISWIASGVGAELEMPLAPGTCLRTELGDPDECGNPLVLSGLPEKASSGSGLLYRSECRESRRARDGSFPIELSLRLSSSRDGLLSLVFLTIPSRCSSSSKAGLASWVSKPELSMVAELPISIPPKFLRVTGL